MAPSIMIPYPRRSETMEDREWLGIHDESGNQEQTYEPPAAAVVQVQLEERVLGCLYSSIQVCGLTE
jgi:hypothetical protein